MIEHTSLRIVEADPWSNDMPRVDQPQDQAAADPKPQRSTGPSSTRRRTLLALAAGLVLIVAATWFSNAESVEHIGDAGALGIRTEAALSAAAVAQNRVAQAALIAEASELGVADTSEVELAVGAARSAVMEFDRRFLFVAQELGSDPSDLEAAATSFTNSVYFALNDIERATVVDAEAALSEIDESFRDLAEGLAGVRDEAFSDIAVARDSAGQVALGARITVAFLLPMIMVFGYRFAVTRATKRRELQRSLEAERAMLRAKDELIANISHELRTPLTGILGFSQEAALDHTLDLGDLRSMASVVAGEANELSRMVDDLITTARDQEGALSLVFEDLDLSEEIDAVLVPAQIAGRDLDVDMAPAYVRGDRLRIRQVIRNLVSNAMKYGGPSVAVVGVVRGEHYALMVLDDGEGVSEELEDRLFSRFVHQGSTPLLSGSVGLGLSIAQRLAEVMGGSLSYERKGGLTSFTLTLPLAENQPAQSPNAF